MMKKLFIMATCALMMMACGGKKTEGADPRQHTIDSLAQANAQQQQEINDIMDIMNRVNDGFREISEAEGRITMDETGEGRGFSRDQVLENMEFIQECMQTNRNLIEELKAKLEASTLAQGASATLAESFRKNIAELEAKLHAQDERVKNLQAQLAEKDAIIAGKDMQIVGQSEQIQALNDDKAALSSEVANKQEQISQQSAEIESKAREVSNLQAENDVKSETLAAQDREMNRAWYVFGTKAELKVQKILDKSEVLKNSNFNKGYFTEIDIRNTRHIPFYSKKATLLTSHPSGSYTMTPNSSGLMELNITDPATFWSVSKYLVVQVK